MCETHSNHEPSSPRQTKNSGVANRLLKFLAGGCAAAAMTAAGAGQADAQLIHAQPTSTDYHVVKDGDTMWDISGTYYGDTFEWPRLWSYNPHITNPHWVYPGDILYLKRIDVPQAGSGPAATGQTAGEKPHQPVAFGTHLPLGGFITTEDLPYSGRIIGSPKEANLLAEHDVVWVGFGEKGYTEAEKEKTSEKNRTAMNHDEEIKNGDIFAIVRPDGTIENGEGETIGQKYIVLGSLEITNVSEKQAHTAIISQSWQEIQRGDFLVPYERQLKVVQPVKGADDVVARIVDSVQPAFSFGEHQYVFINKGAENNVRVGNRFFIYQRFEGLDRPGVEADDAIPWQRVGQVLVLDVREQYATAVITDSSREIRIGDRLEMYKGY